MKNSRVDKAAKTVTVQTDHFSDWAMYALFWLNSDVKDLKIGEATRLQVLSMMNEPGAPIGEHPEIAITAAKVLENPNNVKNWKKTGEGTIQASGLKAVYKAPDFLKFEESAAVSVEIHNWVPAELRPDRGTRY